MSNLELIQIICSIISLTIAIVVCIKNVRFYSNLGRDLKSVNATVEMVEDYREDD